MKQETKSKYRCYHDGFCCKIEKYSTKEEFELAKKELNNHGIFLRGVQSSSGLIWWQSPCQALDESKKINRCLIYNIRPLACRQFLCGKNSPDDKRPFTDDNYNLNYLKQLLTNNKEFRLIKNEMENQAIETWGKRFGYNLIPVNYKDTYARNKK